MVAAPHRRARRRAGRQSGSGVCTPGAYL